MDCDDLFINKLTFEEPGLIFPFTIMSELIKSNLLIAASLGWANCRLHEDLFKTLTLKGHRHREALNDCIGWKFSDPNFHSVFMCCPGFIFDVFLRYPHLYTCKFNTLYSFVVLCSSLYLLGTHLASLACLCTHPVPFCVNIYIYDISSPISAG